MFQFAGARFGLSRSVGFGSKDVAFQRCWWVFFVWLVYSCVDLWRCDRNVRVLIRWINGRSIVRYFERLLCQFSMEVFRISYQNIIILHWIWNSNRKNITINISVIHFDSKSKKLCEKLKNFQMFIIEFFKCLYRN